MVKKKSYHFNSRTTSSSSQCTNQRKAVSVCSSLEQDIWIWVILEVFFITWCEKACCLLLETQNCLQLQEAKKQITWKQNWKKMLTTQNSANNYKIYWGRKMRKYKHKKKSYGHSTLLDSTAALNTFPWENLVRKKPSLCITPLSVIHQAHSLQNNPPAPVLIIF